MKFVSIQVAHTPPYQTIYQQQDWGSTVLFALDDEGNVWRNDEPYQNSDDKWVIVSLVKKESL
jgi:hypothetical protein